ncbi:CheW-like protein [Syntrophomonas zehnderi OL-4]|uniref:CheW-like protein n=1 Tax=Syntrophomonas zehnderi OL-4 TaxID=690567 RepID=A0A0E4C8R5_9FIRM|nr:chemotaxis protein CheW [Syntrophomonas zehnderi]CFX66267.1 CheW-like protein [Syntrophomonas zehnderi OL-4]
MDTAIDYKDQEQQVTDDVVQVVAFQLGDEEYAVDILNVQEINRLLNVTRVPRSPDYIDGVVNLRGSIIPVINLHTKFNLNKNGEDEDTRIIVFQFEDVKAGIIVDKVSEVLHLHRSDIEETSKVYNSMDAEMIKGVAKVEDRLLILLDLQKLLGIDII